MFHPEELYFIYVLLLFGFGTLLVTEVALIAQRSGVHAIAVNPVALISLFILMIHVVVPALKYFRDFYRHQPIYEPSSLIFNIVMIMVGYIIIMVLARARRFAVKHNDPATKPHYFARRALKIGIGIYLFGMFFAIRDLQTITSTISLNDFLQDRIAASSERGFQRIFTNFMVSGIMLTFAALLYQRRRILSVYGLMLISFVIFAYYYYYIISSRNSMLIVTITLASVFFFISPRAPTAGRISFRRMAVYCVLIVGLIGAVYYTTLARYSSNDSDYLRERREEIFMYTLDGAFGNDELSIWLWENDFKLSYGFTYLAAFMVIVPRAIWPEKPTGAGPVLKNTLYPGSYVIGQAGNSSFTTGLFTESRMNFGILGTILFPIIWFFTILQIHRFIFSARTLASQVAWIFLFVLGSTVFVYAEFLGFLIKAGTYMFPLGIAAFLSRVKV